MVCFPHSSRVSMVSGPPRFLVDCLVSSHITRLPSLVETLRRLEKKRSVFQHKKPTHLGKTDHKSPENLGVQGHRSASAADEVVSSLVKHYKEEDLKNRQAGQNR